MPRMADAARRAGVALGTVSNVLNQPEKVSEHTRMRVHRAIEELGFVPNRAARLLAAGTSSTIGFVIIDLSNSFFLDMARGAEREAHEHGLSVLLADSDMQDGKQKTYLQLFNEERVAGVLLAPLPGTLTEMRAIRERGTRVVVLNDFAGADTCSVSVDNELGGYTATRHLIQTGRRRLVFAGEHRGVGPLDERAHGAARAIAETNGAVTMEFLPTHEVQVEQGREVGRLLAARPLGERPDGVVAAADLLALGIVQAMLADGVRIPDDVAIIGYDNNRSAWESVVPISTIAQPGEDMGHVATRLLLDELRSGADHVHEHVVLKPTLIVRSSSGAVPLTGAG